MIRLKLTAIGIMCGTSKDGIDMMVGETDGINPLDSIATVSLQFPVIYPMILRAAEYALKNTHGSLELADKELDKYTHQYLKTILKNEDIKAKVTEIKNYLNILDNRPVTIADITAKYTLLCIDLIRQLLTKAKLLPSAIDVIGDHGIALYHNPQRNITIQIADGQKLANETNIFVVNDFRTQDVKNGGQGAPLAPIYHATLINSKKEFESSWVIVNLGGTANITLKKEGRLIGFDTGPANVLLDLFIRNYTYGELSYDESGKNALKGEVNELLLDHLKKSAIDINGENYLEKLPPKSLDISNYKLIDEVKNYSFEDVCATLASFTAYCVIQGIKLMQFQIKHLIVCGGGAKNLALLKYLEYFAEEILNNKIKVSKAYEIGIDSDYLEAELFAFLAVKTIYKEPLSFTTTTGCNKDTLGGHGYLPRVTNDRIGSLIKQNPELLKGYIIA